MTEANQGTLIEGVKNRAKELSDSALPAEEQARIEELQDEIKKDHKKHKKLSAKAAKALTVRNEMDTEWHTDDEPPIENLPEGTSVAYKITDEGGFTTVHVGLQVKGNEAADEGELAHLGRFSDQQYQRSHPNEYKPVHFGRGDQDRTFKTGVVSAGEGLNPELDGEIHLTAIDTESNDFALIAHAVDVVTRGEVNLRINEHEAERNAELAARGYRSDSPDYRFSDALEHEFLGAS